MGRIAVIDEIDTPRDGRKPIIYERYNGRLFQKQTKYTHVQVRRDERKPGRWLPVAGTGEWFHPKEKVEIIHE